jgi:ABC-2 type transport system ATP-binding protein
MGFITHFNLNYGIFSHFYLKFILIVILKNKNLEFTMSHPSKAILEVKELTKEFPAKETKKTFTAVDHISFSLHSGEILGLLGPNGAGKTTTIQMLLSTLRPTSGSIFFFGKDFFKNRSEILKEISFASTYISLPSHLTIKENLEIHGKLYELSGKTLHSRIEKFLAEFDVLEMQNRTMVSLSAGQKTRVMLARAFMTYPKIVLLDEPTAALDPDMAQEVRKFILRQQQEYKVSILFTSHNMGEVADLCERILVLKSGKIIADDTPDALANSVSTCQVNLIVGDGLKRTISYAAEQKLKYSVEERWISIEVDEHKIADLLAGLAAAEVSYSQIWIEKPTLEDYFIHISQQQTPKI